MRSPLKNSGSHHSPGRLSRLFLRVLPWPENASLPAFSQLTEQAVRIGSVWLLYHIFLQEGMEITPMLAAAGLLTGEIASVLFIFTFAANKTLLPSSLSACFHRCRTLLTMSIPVTASRVSLTLLQSVEAVLIPLSLRQSGLSSTEALSLYGILTGMSLAFLLFPNAVTSSLSAMLLPVVSEEQAKGNMQKISQAIEYTLLFGMNIGILCMGYFSALWKRAGNTMLPSAAGRRILTDPGMDLPVPLSVRQLKQHPSRTWKNPGYFF